MEKEKYEPTQEEIEKAEEMAVEGEMTPEQERMSEERSETFEAGAKHGENELLSMNKYDLAKEKMMVDAGLTREAADLLRKYEVMYDVAHDCLEVKTLISISEELFLELIEKLPVSSVRVSSRRTITEDLIKADDVYQSITKRMLDALRNNKEFGHERSIFLEDIIAHASNKEKELKKADEILNDLGAGTEWTAVALVSGNPNFYKIVLQSK